MSYQKILQIHKSTDNAELELRFQIKNKDTLKRLVSSIDCDKTMEQSINFISPGIDLNRICQLSFVDGVKKQTTYMSKQTIERTPNIDAVLPYKLVLSVEKTIPSFDINLSKMARIKLRLSMRPEEIAGWRIDITLVKNVVDIKKDLKRDKDKMLYALKVEDFDSDAAPWDYADALELEVEYIGGEKNLSPVSIETVTSYIFNSIEPQYKNMADYKKITYQIASYMIEPKYLEDFRQRKGTRDLYNRVMELNKREYFKNVFVHITDFYLLDKADGVRALITIEGKNFSALTDSITIKPLKKPYEKVTIFDAEYISHGDVKTYYVFDVLVFNGENLTTSSTSSRIKYIAKVVEMSEGNAVSKDIIPLTENYKSEISDMWERAQKSKKYEVDGLIFTPKGEPYRSMRSWKWKPLEFMSIDFLVKEAPVEMGEYPYIPKKGHTMMFLFSGIDKQLYDKLRLITVSGYDKLFPRQNMYKYFPIQFCPSDEPYAYIYYHPDDSKFTKKQILNNVCEFKRINLDSTPTWDLMRVRTDRKMDLDRGNYFGNSFYVAEYTWQNYHNPLKFDDLIISSTEFMDHGYFKEDTSKIFKQVITFNSFVKGQLLSKFAKSEWIVDLAAGRGQDMFRVSDAGIKNALFIDNDAQALSELISRKHDFQRGIKRLNTRIYTKIADLTVDYRITLKSIEQIGVPLGGIDIIMCNFAIHYLIGTPENVRNLIHLIDKLLKPGGHFFFTAFNGEKIFDLLKDTDAWDIREGEVLKYSIKKKYDAPVLEPTGQQIDVLLPFSGGKYYTEYLVNFKYILKEFSLNGFMVGKTDGFDSMIPQFKVELPRVYPSITADDLTFLSLYSYGIVTKKKSADGGMTAGGSKNVTRELLSEIAEHYPHPELYIDLLMSQIKLTHNPIITIDDIKYKLPYQNRCKLTRPQIHIGQRKLFLTEIQFLTDNDAKYCVYAGAAPGHKTHYLSQLFPHIKFILVDPNKFDIKLPNLVSHRKTKHPDIVHLKYAYPTESNIGELSVDFIKNSDYKIYIIEDYMTNEYSELLKSFDHTFISDIRSNVDPATTHPTDFDILWNSSMMFNWISILRPVMSMLKFRPLYNIKNYDISEMPDFDLSKKYGIDFIANLKKNKYIMPKSKLYIQAWAGRKSTELRMWIRRKDLKIFVEYDSIDIEEKLFYFNNINRGICFHVNDNANKYNHFCHCNDCALENNIWENYRKKYNGESVIEHVIRLGVITGRPLRDIHQNIVFDKDPDLNGFIAVNKSLLPLEDFIDQKKLSKRHKGDAGRAEN